MHEGTKQPDRGGRRPARLWAGIALLLAFVLMSASAQAAETKRFEPIRKTERSLVFKVRGVDAKRIVSAHALMRSKDRAKPRYRRVERRLSISRVRSVANRKRVLTVRKPRSIGGGKLSLTLEARSPAPSPGTSCSFGEFSATRIPGACWRPYSDSSPFNTPVAGKAEAPNSDALVARLMSFATTPDKINTNNAGTDGDWSHPIYYSQPSDPVFTVDCVESWGTCDIEGMQVRIPDQAQPAGGGDGHMAVIDQASGWEYDLWQVRSKPAGGGTIAVSWGGRTAIGTADADGLGSNATAAHFGLAAGMIRPAEIAAGEINHALFSVVKCTNGTSVAPAGDGAGTPCSKMGLSNANAPAMGQHFYLDMSEARDRRPRRARLAEDDPAGDGGVRNLRRRHRQRRMERDVRVRLQLHELRPEGSLDRPRRPARGAQV